MGYEAFHPSIVFGLSSRGNRRLGEVVRLLDAAKPEVQRQARFRSVMYRYLLAGARVAHARRDPASRDLARDAMAVAAEKTPSFPRHPTIGRPSATEQELTDLRAIAEHPHP